MGVAAWKDIFDASVLRLCRTHPYVSSTALALVPVERPESNTLSTDMYGRVYVGTQRQWDVEGMSTIIYHELWHLLFQHHKRAESLVPFEKTIANIAMDMEINGTEKVGIHGEINSGASHLKFPFEVFTPRHFGLDEGLMMEQYYEELLQQAKEQQDGEGGGQGQSEGQQGKGKGQPHVGFGDCGSCASGEPQEGDEPSPENSDTPGMTAKELEDLAKSTAREISEASKSRGNIPGWMKRWADDMCKTKHDWKPELRATIRNSMTTVTGRGIPSYQRPHRKQQLHGRVLLPGQRQPVIKVAVVCDTSGSMSEKQMGQSLAEVEGVLQFTKQVTVFATDSAASTAQKVMRRSQVNLMGGGGTDMGVGIQAAADHTPTPDLIICLTDGITPWPAKAPKGIKTIIGLIGEGSTYYRLPEWATIVNIPLDEE